MAKVLKEMIRASVSSSKFLLIGINPTDKLKGMFKLEKLIYFVTVNFVRNYYIPNDWFSMEANSSIFSYSAGEMSL